MRISPPRVMNVVDLFPTLSPDGLVYHYTSQKSLLGIFESKCLWATNVLYMNDAAEIQYAIELLRTRLGEIEGSLSDDERKVFKEVDNNIIAGTRDQLEGVYACSFSSQPDQLSQWRGYCPGGAGFSIGFDLKYLRNQGTISRQKFRVAHCVYSQYRKTHF